MKCPCCGEQTDREYIIIHNKLYLPDGTVNHFFPTPLRYLETLLKTGRLERPSKHTLRAAMDVHLSKLRAFMKEKNMPFTIETKETEYTLRRHTA